MQGQSFEVDKIKLKVVIDNDAMRISIAKQDGQPFTVKDPLLVLDALLVTDVQFWLKLWAEQDKHVITPDYQVYLDGHMWGDGKLHGRGFGGAHFKYHTADGYDIDTWNMWSQGQVPELFRPLFRVNCTQIKSDYEGVSHEVDE